MGIVHKIKQMVGKGVDWKDRCERAQASSDRWEFKFNKLNAQLKAILNEANKNG